MTYIFPVRQSAKDILQNYRNVKTDGSDATLNVNVWKVLIDVCVPVGMFS